MSLIDGVAGLNLSMDATHRLDVDFMMNDDSLLVHTRSCTLLAQSHRPLLVELTLPLHLFLVSRVGSFFLIALEIVGLAALEHWNP